MVSNLQSRAPGGRERCKIRVMPDALGSVGLRLFEPRRATITLTTLLVLHVFAFLVFYPAGVTVADEGTYVRQAQLILSGSTSIERVDPFTGEDVAFQPITRYPLGTALVLLPFVALGGREAACLASLLCTVLAVGVTGRWLYESGRSPLFAALVLAYPPTLVLSRLAMSEAASLLVVALALWFHGRGQTRGARWLFAAGLAGGLSFAFREANVLLLAPFFLGSLLRRDTGWPALVVGGALGLCVRALSAWFFFGDPFFTKAPDAFSLEAIASTAPVYLFSLLVFVPGGLVAAFAYRGPRRPELIATVALFVLFHLAYAYSGEPSGWAKRLVLGPRYFVPLLPVLAYASAEVWPRLAVWLRGRAGNRGDALEQGAGLAAMAATALLAVAIVGVQWAHAEWSRDQAVIRSAILEHTHAGTTVVTNWKATGKFIDLVDDDRVILPREGMGSSLIERLLAEQDFFYLVLLDRSDSVFWRRDAFDNAMFVSGIRHRKEILVDLEATPTDRLRIWRVRD